MLSVSLTQKVSLFQDDLRPDLSLYNLSFMRTPNLQKLADTGTVFDRAYCQQCETILSRFDITVSQD